MHVSFAGWLGSLQVAGRSVPIILSKQKEINDWEEPGVQDWRRTEWPDSFFLVSRHTLKLLSPGQCDIYEKNKHIDQWTEKRFQK